MKENKLGFTGLTFFSLVCDSYPVTATVRLVCAQKVQLGLVCGNGQSGAVMEGLALQLSLEVLVGLLEKVVALVTVDHPRFWAPAFCNRERGVYVGT